MNIRYFSTFLCTAFLGFSSSSWCSLSSVDQKIKLQEIRDDFLQEKSSQEGALAKLKEKFNSFLKKYEDLEKEKNKLAEGKEVYLLAFEISDKKLNGLGNELRRYNSKELLLETVLDRDVRAEWMTLVRLCMALKESTDSIFSRFKEIKKKYDETKNKFETFWKGDQGDKLLILENKIAKKYREIGRINQQIKKANDELKVPVFLLASVDVETGCNKKYCCEKNFFFSRGKELCLKGKKKRGLSLMKENHACGQGGFHKYLDGYEKI